jgi:DNA adenine methylase
MGIFRYPGGKSKLLEPINEYLHPIVQKKNAMADVFVGGGSVLVQTAKDFPHIQLFANDKDSCIYSFWKLLENDDQQQIDAFYDLVRQTPTIKLFQKMRAAGIPLDLVERAYYAVFFNRTAFSGILTSGPIGGYEQKSKWAIGCRYNADRIIKEFEELRSLLHGRFKMSNLDCITFLDSLKNVALYLDPPYYVKGSGLYPVSMTPQEHVDLAKRLRSQKDWVLSYDMCPEIDDIYSWANKIPLDARYSIRDKKKNWTAKQEYIILPH